MKKYIKEIIIGGSIIIATIIFVTFNQSTPADHCYNKAYKDSSGLEFLEKAGVETCLVSI